MFKFAKIEFMKTTYVTRFVLLFSFIGFSQNWHTNFDDAQKEATSQNKNIVLVFQGSDWCAPCIKLDKEVWSTQEFQNLANKHFIMLKADFPRRKANKLSKTLTDQNAKLAQTYNTEGYFPLVVLLDAKANVLGKMGYEKITPTAYFNKLTAFEK